jgi:isoquinoline 1-oxidoreductase subunit beta
MTTTQNRARIVSGVSRRGFLGTMFSAGALVLSAPLLSTEAFAAGTVDGAAFHPSVYLGIEPDGTVIIVTHRSEMGTGIRTALPSVAADELDAQWSRVKIQQAIGDKKYGNQNTDGSCSIRDFYEAFREAGATARLMLEQAAAKQWGVDASECRARNHEVVHSKSGRKLDYGPAAVLAAKQKTPPAKDLLRYKTPQEYRYIGKDVPIVDIEGITTGRAVFGMDEHRPGMVFASIERSPVVGGTLKSLDDKDTRAVKGVQDVVTIDAAKPPYGFQALGGVAVIADNTWAAMQGRKQLKVQWTPGEHAIFTSDTARNAMFATVHAPQKVVRNIGNVDGEFSKGGKTFEADYYVPMLSHVSMEPPVAVAEYRNGKVECWCPTQNPQAVQDTVAQAVGIKPEEVICNVSLLGGGFGRKSKPDYVAEAAILSKRLGKPVKVVWSREDDIHWDYFQAGGAMYMKAALNEKGAPSAWLQRSAYPPIFYLFDASVRQASLELGLGWVDLPFALPHHRAENGPVEPHVRYGWLRSVTNISNAFATCSFTDELAHQAGRDPIEYYLELLGPDRKINFKKEGTENSNYGRSEEDFPLDTARYRRVVQLVAEKSGWANKKPGKGRAWGFAAHRSFLTYVAAVVEVEVDDKGRVRIPRVDYAIDAGRVINPDRVKNQFEGAAVFGTSIAMMGEITAVDGRIQQSNFHNYPVARINEAPVITNVHIVPSDALPAGAGEPGVPPIAPAICNAIFAATGKRVRELPIKKTKLV